MEFLQINQVSFCYPGQKAPAVAGVDLNLRKNEITALVGPNGSGKTTLTRLMIGILKAQSGDIRLEGEPLAQYTLAQAAQRIGYVFQNPDLQFFCSSVEAEVGFGPVNQGLEPGEVRRKVDFYLDYFELNNHRNAFPLHLSQGEKQRLALAAVLANEPGYLILDEPTVGLDEYRKSLLADYLRKVASEGRGMLLVSHDSGFVDRMADRVVQMENAQISADSLGQENTNR